MKIVSGDVMNLKETLLLFLVALFLVVSKINGVEGRAKAISIEENLELERQLKILNKPAVKTIKTEYGDIYDCVDINRQPAFDHPLLKNHTIQYAYIEVSIPDERFYGAQASINVWNPQVVGDQFSNSQIWLQNGQLGDQLNVIEAGWTVNTFIFGDNRTRTFTYWTTDGYRKTGCYNNLCPGFVQVSKDVTPDMVLDPVSVIDANQVEVKVKIERDHDEYDGTNGYWLTLNDIDVGYWPNYLFSSLHNGAYEAHFGGQVFNPANEDFPKMGSGMSTFHGYRESGFFANVQILHHTFVNPDPFVVKIYEDSPCYLVGENLGLHPNLGGYSFYFGGGGGKWYNC